MYEVVHKALCGVQITKMSETAYTIIYTKIGWLKGKTHL